MMQVHILNTTISVMWQR